MKKANQSVLLILCLLFTGSILVLSACCEEGEDTSKEDTQIRGVGEEKRDELNQAWINADSINTTNSFYIQPDIEKVISFKIDRDEVNKLLEIVDSTKEKNLLRLRIFMALDNQLALPPASPQSIFRPVLDLSTLNKTDTVFQSKIAFEMDYLKIDIIDYLKGIIRRWPNKPIDPETTLKLITAWDTLDRDSINTVMYEEDTKPVKQERVKYYTYDSSDTQKALADLRRKKDDLLYLHLGVNENPSDTIPFCTILHIDNPANFKHPERIDFNDPPMFEFAAPCPKYCGNDGSFN